MFLVVWQIIFSTDYILLPFFILMWVLIALRFRNKHYKGSVVYRYFMPALVIRLVGALLSAFMYQYYYGYGDTYFYYFGINDTFNALFSNPGAAYEIIFKDFYDWDLSTHSYLTYRGIFTKPKEAMVIKLGAFMSPFGLGTYIGTSFAITFVSFMGCWGIYRVFYNLYPHLHRTLAFPILFLPSLCFWGTGIMKDSIVLAGLGLFINGIYYLFISKQKKVLRSVFLILFGTFLMQSIKIYVFASIAPASLLWIFFMYKNKIRNSILRKVASPLFFITGAAVGLFALQKLGESYSQFTLEGFLEEANKVQWWLKLSTERDGGSGYDLGDIDPSMSGLLRVFPKAVIVTLFRPFLWETKKLILLPSVLEAFVTLGFTIYVFFKVGILNIVRISLSNPVILFCLTFSIIFAFCVGFTAFNFGALARYKIPCLPFYITALIIMLDAKKNQGKTIESNA